ncbi:hypothetical protein BGX27_010206 [Mortierella sp. AM989]|nr:hypothetical protein BGX27_010206 [Mortierella sp. AM989]
MLVLLVSLATATLYATAATTKAVVNLAADPSPSGDGEACAHLMSRQDCGYLGINKDECTQRQCCWSPSMMPVPWCFQKKTEEYLCAADIASRRDCGYMGINAQECYTRNCCWDSNPNTLNAPFCFMKQYACKGYGVQNVQESDTGFVIDLQLIGEGCARFGQDIPSLTALVDFETESRIRVKILDKNSPRYEIPIDALPSTSSTIRRVGAAKRRYTFTYNKSPFTFSIKRVLDGEVIFDSSVAGMDSLVFEDEYLELSTVVPQNADIYGLGEVTSGFRRDSRGTRQTMWNRDAATPVDENLYGSHPFHLEMRGNGTAHGVFMRNSNGMDVIITPQKLTYKAIGGIIDLTIFVGPSPKDVINQYTEVIGRPLMPPAWSMGFHQSRYGYKNIDAVEQVVKRFRQENLPLDGVWIDIDYMDSFKDFTYDEARFPKARIRALAENLAANNQNMVLIIDPGIPVLPGYEPYDIGMKNDVFIRTPTGKPVEGRVWPGQTYFPDFFNTNETWTFWKEELRKTREDIGENVYPWIDMNEPSNFCNGACTKDEPSATADSVAESHIVRRGDANALPINLKYIINNAGRQAPLDEKTLADNAFHKNGLRLTDTHNLYGHMESKATYDSLLKLKPDQRPFILTRSTFAGTGAYAAHWTGDNWSQWNHLHFSISGILSFGLFGIPFTGADICGFIGDTTEELCLRWHQLGALYPFSRNHNAINTIDQEPFIWPNTVLPAARKALEIRYSLLPYYYTLFQKSHKTGQPLWQPLFFQYPQDTLTLRNDKQFLLGDGVMVSPALYQGQIQVKAYFPGNGRWFDFTTLQCVMERDSSGVKDGDRVNRYQFLKARPDTDPIPMTIAGGHVIPTQNPKLTVAETRLQPVSLIVALDNEGNAQGEMYIDDGKSINNVYQATIAWELNLGQQLISHPALQSPSSQGSDLKGMTSAQAQEFKNQLAHGDKIEKIVILGLNFARFGGERTFDSPGTGVGGYPGAFTGRNVHLYTQGQPKSIQRRDMGHSQVEASGEFKRSIKQTVFESEVFEQSPEKASIHMDYGATGGNAHIAKVAALTSLNINGAVVPIGDSLHGGLNGAQGQDPTTGMAWEVNQDAGTLTLTGLQMDLFNGWFINWKMA